MRRQLSIIAVAAAAALSSAALPVTAAAAPGSDVVQTTGFCLPDVPCGGADGNSGTLTVTVSAPDSPHTITPGEYTYSYQLDSHNTDDFIATFGLRDVAPSSIAQTGTVQEPGVPADVTGPASWQFTIMFTGDFTVHLYVVSDQPPASGTAAITGVAGRADAPWSLTVGTLVPSGDATAPTSTASPAPATRAWATITATATVRDTTGDTVGTAGPMICWTSHGVRVGITATDAGSGVASIGFAATGAQRIPPTTDGGASATVPITSRGRTTVTYHATDRAGNAETPANSETVLVGSSLSCALPTPASFTPPRHGSATIAGTLHTFGRSLPFHYTMHF